VTAAPAAPGSIGLLTAAVAIVGANSLLLSPIATAVAADLPGTDAAAVMLAAAAFGLGTAASALLLAPQVDRIGADRALIRAVLGMAAGLGLSALAPGLFWLAAAQSICGIAAGLALPAAYALAAQIAPRGQEGRTIGRVLSGWTISLVFGVAGSAALTDLIGWRAVYGLLAAGGAGERLLERHTVIGGDRCRWRCLHGGVGHVGLRVPVLPLVRAGTNCPPRWPA
jgi:DHA1 family inner membrane transport protein